MLQNNQTRIQFKHKSIYLLRQDSIEVKLIRIIILKYLQISYFIA